MAALRVGVVLLLLYIISFVYGYGESVKATKETVSFQIRLEWDDWQPAGISRKMILANGQFPAPSLEVRQGDDVEFLVINELPFSTTVHFHGIEQHNTPWSDGVPGISQMPIAPGESFLYKWRATNYRSYFYHAHKRGQQDDGLYGAIHVQPDSSIIRPFALISDKQYVLRVMQEAESKSTPIILSDVRQLTSEEIWEAEIATGRDALRANALLLNGKGSVNCLEQESIDQFTTAAQKGILGNQSLTDIGCIPPTNVPSQGDYPYNISAVPSSVFAGCVPSHGLTERLYASADELYVSYDIISAATISKVAFSIDEHSLYVYAIDGQYVEPTLVDVITITNGARYSVLVKVDKPMGDYTIRVANTGVNQILHGTALMTYHNDGGGEVQQQPSVPSIDISGMPTSPEYTLLNQSTIIPFPPQTVAHVHVAQTHILTLQRYNHYPLALEESLPLLFHPETSTKNLTISARNGTWVDIIFDVANHLQPPHPIHKHPNKFFVIGEGEGRWNYSSVSEAIQHIPASFNLEKPHFRDTFETPAAETGPSWLAIRYHVVNPGAFLLHCHIQVHHSGGMALALLDGIDKWPEVPQEYRLADSTSSS
ncbi:multicopper oxidase-domain-containing protein [Aspergillus crustosus]